ncbi:hypothetical protein [Hydrocoleum sp. CS-953]|uniref:hypothetical protein n=1 Tax=Hydrocoleum sp. CS-953 TaxID=1671698 RepID=UPI00143CD15F|nr:hypothetical protein [Hydrocoleum sp. CS-953]
MTNKGLSNFQPGKSSSFSVNRGEKVGILGKYGRKITQGILSTNFSITPISPDS